MRLPARLFSAESDPEKYSYPDADEKLKSYKYAILGADNVWHYRGDPYGFATEARVGDVLALTDVIPAMKKCGGVDFNYCAGHDKEMKLIAVLKSPKTGRVMEVITDQPGVQCYTGQGLNHTGKGGVHYGKYAGLCLETQHYPDAIHQPQFHSIVLRPEDTYDTTTIYKFYAE